MTPKGVLLLLVCVLLLGCSQSGDERTVSLRESVSRLPPIWEYSLPAEGDATAVTFLPDCAQVAVGTQHGQIRLGRIGSSEPGRRFNDPTGYVHDISVSPDGNRLLSVESASESLSGPGGKAVTIRYRDLRTGATLGTTLAQGSLAHVTFGPAGDIASVTTSDRFYLLSVADTVQVITESARPEFFQRPHRTRVQPAFFLSSKDRTQIIALGRIWETDGRSATFLKELADQPDALDVRLMRGFYGEQVRWDERYFLLPGIYVPVKEAAISVSPLHQLRVTSRIRTHPKAVFDQIIYIPRVGTTSSDWLGVVDRHQIFLINLRKKEVMQLTDSSVYSRRIAVSPDGRRIAGCGDWGVSVWEIPLN